MQRITIVTGHYGSGKSEFSVNLALREVARSSLPISLVDVDIVNPYFRSREQRALLERRGIRVVANIMKIDVGVDLPALAPDIISPLQDHHMLTIVDTGGDPVGVRILRSIRRFIPTEDTEVLCLVNASRPETKDAESAIRMLRSIETASSLRVTGLVNNTHLLEQTTPEEIRRGDAVCKEIHERTGIPIRYAGVMRSLLDDLEPDIAGDVVPIAMLLRYTWMMH